MACVCLQRTTISLASRWRGRALKTSFLENPVVQVSLLLSFVENHLFLRCGVAVCD